MTIKYLDEPEIDVKYKRRLFLGVLDKTPDLNTQIRVGDNKTIEQEILSPAHGEKKNYNLFPILLLWENSEKVTKYMSVEE